MDETQFWSLVEEARRDSQGDWYQEVEILEGMLTRLSAGEIIGFNENLDRLMAMSYHNDLWAAAYLINGGCSEELFDWFRGWLITQGKTIFYTALRNPEALAYAAEPEVECEAMLLVARQAYKKKMGVEMPTREKASPRLVGDEWDEATVEEMFPVLARRFNYA